MDASTEKFLNQLREELKKDLGQNLQALILYGSLARGDFVPGRSDINLMLVLKVVDSAALFSVGRVFHKYRRHRFATPVVTDQGYLDSSVDVFPIEFEELKRHHRLLHGEDLISPLLISRPQLRLELEREFKQNLLWLRELLIEYPDLSREFMKGLLNAGRSLYTHLRALTLLQPEPEQKQELLERVEHITGIKLPAIKWLILLRMQPKPPKKAEVLKMVQKLLEETALLARFIDRGER